MFKTLVEDTDILEEIRQLENVVLYIEHITVPEVWCSIQNVTVACTGVEAVGPITACMNTAHYKYASMYMSLVEDEMTVYVIYERVPRHHRELN